MATEDALQRLREQEQTYLSIDRKKLIRTNLGEESLEAQLNPILDDIDESYGLAQAHAALVHDRYVNDVIGVFTSLNNQLSEQSNRNNQDYIAQKNKFISNCDSQLEELKLHWTPFIAAAVKSRGLLEDQGILKEYEKTVQSLRGESEETLNRIKEEAASTIESAKKLAEEIENKARKTAAKISVKAAQDQFIEARQPLGILIGIWSVISIVSLIAFFIFLFRYLNIEIPEEWTWQLVYYSLIRLAIVGAIGTILAFSLRIFRSSLHMYLHNNHRMRLTNSIEAFVESAITPEQRDRILAHLVEAVASFGNSGLLGQGESSDTGSKMTIDNITRTFGEFPKSGS